MRVFPTLYGVRRVQVVDHLTLLFHLVVIGLLSDLRVVCDDGLVGLEVFAYSLVDGRLSQFVIVGGLHLDHVFQVGVHVARVELGVLLICAPASKLLMNVNACIALGFRRYLQRRLVALILSAQSS